MMDNFFIAGFVPVSLIDFPGRIASVVFTHGCNLRCRYCHNPELVTGKPSANMLDDFLSYLQGKEIEGVAVTGGEPLFSSGIQSFLAHVKWVGCDVKLDTNGFSHAKLENICAKGLADFVSVDLKAFNDADTAYITRTDAGLEPFRRTVSVLKDHSVSFELRHTLWKVPDSDDVRRVMDKAETDRLSVQFPMRKGRWLDKRFNVFLSEADIEKVRNVFKDYDVVYRNLPDKQSL